MTGRIPSRDLRTAALVLIVSLSIGACAETSVPITSTTTSVPQLSTSSSTTSLGADTTTAISPLPGQLLVLGDWGSGTLPQGAVAGAMQRYAQDNPVEAILTTGDNFYSDEGAVLIGPFSWATADQIPFWVTWGNHDIETDSRVDLVNQVFDNPPRWTLHQWGAVDVVILDSNDVSSIQQAAFFLAAMAESERPMIVAMHHPPYSCSHHGSTVEVVNEMVGVFDDDVILVLAGHDHSYQRFENNDVGYIVTGGGGRFLYGLSDCPDNHPDRLAGAELFHFLAMDQNEESVVVTAIDVNGVVFDELTIPIPAS